jgi:hypothetical protein
MTSAVNHRATFKFKFPLVQGEWCNADILVGRFGVLSSTLLVDRFGDWKVPKPADKNVGATPHGLISLKRQLDCRCFPGMLAV